MYSTCLFCTSELGANGAIEHFPVGRRLAFDGAKGRLWVVCRTCERWNLTPLEERWEAIEECERAFGATRLRVSTDQVGLARLKEGTELVRIGDPQRPEMAAWRYGDQFGRRRRRQYAVMAGGAVAVGAVAISGSMLGVLGLGAVSPAMNLYHLGRGLYQHRTIVRVPAGPEHTVPLRLQYVREAKLEREGDGVVLTLRAAQGAEAPWWRFTRDGQELQLRGMDAVRATGALLPRVNHAGGSKRQIALAVEQLETARDPLELFAQVVALRSWRPQAGFPLVKRSAVSLSSLSNVTKLALEMAAHEDAERHALESELHILEAAWRDAEEIAGIADDMFLPPSIDERLARMKRARGEAH